MVKYDNLMIDIETLATSSDAVILSISCVPFTYDDGIILILDKKHCFYSTINTTSNGNRYIDEKTIKFWVNTNKDFIQECQDSVYTLSDTLKKVDEYIKKRCTKNVLVWSRGPSFDANIMKHAYSHFGMKLPWVYNSERCVRTVEQILQIKNLELHKKLINFIGVKHNALDDAWHQSRYVANAMCNILNTSNVLK